MRGAEMAKASICLMGFITILVIPGFLFAQENQTSVLIEVEESFEMGEVLTFEYTLLSDVDQEVVVTPYVKCPSLPSPPVEETKATLSAGVPYRGEYRDLAIKPGTPPQGCKAVVKVSGKETQVYSEPFKIEAPEPLTLELLVCEDKSCKKPGRYFTPGSAVYFQTKPDQASLTIIHPNGTKPKLVSPTSWTPREFGLYQVEATLMKDGKTASQTGEFMVVQPARKIQKSRLVAEKMKRFSASTPAAEKP